MEGYLFHEPSTKARSLLKSKRWRKRYFVLEDAGLVHYPTEKKDPIHMVLAVDFIDLAEMTKCIVAAHPGKGYEIVIRPAGFVMRAADEETAGRWQKRINRRQKQLRKAMLEQQLSPVAYEPYQQQQDNQPGTFSQSSSRRRSSLFRRRKSLSSEQLVTLKASNQQVLDLSGTKLGEKRAMTTVSNFEGKMFDAITQENTFSCLCPCTNDSSGIGSSPENKECGR
jgi:hypothetical protein